MLCSTFYCHIFSPLNMSWSRPRFCKTLGFLSDDAIIKVCVSRLCSRCIVTLALNNYIYNLFLRFVFLVKMIDHNSGWSVFNLRRQAYLENDCIDFWVTKRPASLVCTFHVYKENPKIWKRTRIYKHKRTIRKNFDVPVISFKWYRSSSASWEFPLESE